MEENVVLVGQKPVMAYVLAAISRLSSGDLVIKARGRAISKAVDVAEVIRRRFLTGLQVKSINIGTERLESKERGPASVSTIEIKLGK